MRECREMAWCSTIAATVATVTAINAGSVTLSGNVKVPNSTPLFFGFTNGIGISPNIASNLILDNGALRYLGATVGSTDRLFQIGRAIDTAATSGTLDSSSPTADTLTFTNPGAITYGLANQADTLGLTGSNGGANTLDPVIGNNGTAAVSVVKSGSGSWTLAGFNTYTGPTTITGGILNAGVASVAGAGGALGLNSAVVLSNTTGAALNISAASTQIGSVTGGGAAGGNVTLGAQTLTVGGDNTSPAAYAGVILGSGSLSKIGTGVQTLSGE